MTMGNLNLGGLQFLINRLENAVIDQGRNIADRLVIIFAITLFPYPEQGAPLLQLTTGNTYGGLTNPQALHQIIQAAGITAEI